MEVGASDEEAEPGADSLRGEGAPGAGRSAAPVRAATGSVAHTARPSLQLAPVVYVTLDPRCKIWKTNLTAAASFGIARGDLIGKSLSTLVVPADRPVLRDHVSRCVGERMVVEAEVRFAIRGRPTVTAQVVSAPFVAVDGTVTECKTTLTDITALKQGQARAIRARDDLLMFVSHDLRNLLTGVFCDRAVAARRARPRAPQGVESARTRPPRHAANAAHDRRSARPGECRGRSAQYRPRQPRRQAHLR